MLTFKVFPKINIFLKILGSNGHYHRIFSRFVLVKGSMYDMVRIKKSKNFCLQGDFGCQMIENLIYKVIIRLKKYLEVKGKDFKMLDSIGIDVEKHIPKGSGLGGGSANAGVILSKINDLFYLNLNQSELNCIASGVGADVAFFASGYESANVSGIGEILQSYDEKIPQIEIFTPDVFCDTSVVYASYDTIPTSIKNLNPLLQNCTSKDILKMGIRDELNDLLKPALKAYPKLEGIEKDLGDEWFFSGSGASFFRLKSLQNPPKNTNSNVMIDGGRR